MADFGAVPIWVYPQSGADPTKMFFSNLTSNGTNSLNTNGVSSYKTFSYTNTGPVNNYLYRCNIHIIDGSIDPLDFGGIAGSLTTGCIFTVTDSNGTVTQTFGDWPLTNNASWSLLAGTDIDRDTGAGDDSLTVRWTLAKAGAPLKLGAGESLNFTVRDDLTPLTQFHIMAQGIIKP